MKKYFITEDVLNNLIKYLSTRPYSEVFQGIATLSSLEKCDCDKKKDEPKTD